MPVSPQDFALWSRMTGSPIPSTPAERMAVAPQVYEFSRNLGRRGAEPSGIRKLIDVAGKTALGLGALAGASYLGYKALEKQPEAAGALVKSGQASSDEPFVMEEVERPEPPSSVEFLDSVVNRYSRPQETPDVENVRVQVLPTDEGVYREGQQIRGFIPKGLLTPVTADVVTTEPPDSVRFARESARGMTRAGLMNEQYAQTAAKRLGTMEFAGAEPPVAGMADPYALREVAALQTRVDIPDTQITVPQPGDFPSFARKLQLDDEVSVDNDVIAANPLSNTAAASQDITSADPASAIGQRISANQTGAATEARRAYVPQETIAAKLSTQQSPVHVEEAGFGLVGAPEAGAAEAFRKGRQYQAMKQDYPGLRDIASPTQEGVSSASILPSVTPPGPVRTASTQEPAQPQVLVTPGARRTAEQDEQELLLRKYAAVKPRATAAPSGTEFLKTKVAQGLPQATQRGTVEHAVAEALEQREGMKTLPPGATAYDLPGSSVSRIVMYPNQQVGITYAGDPSSEYGAKSTPEFYGELDAILKSGEFGRGGKHSAGGFIQAGKNLGLLY